MSTVQIVSPQSSTSLLHSTLSHSTCFAAHCFTAHYITAHCGTVHQHIAQRALLQPGPIVQHSTAPVTHRLESNTGPRNRQRN